MPLPARSIVLPILLLLLSCSRSATIEVQIDNFIGELDCANTWDDGANSVWFRLGNSTTQLTIEKNYELKWNGPRQETFDLWASWYLNGNPSHHDFIERTETIEDGGTYRWTFTNTAGLDTVMGFETPITVGIEETFSR